MKSIIDLSNTSFNFVEFINGFSDTLPETAVFDRKKNLINVADFGTIFIGLEKVTDSDVFDSMIESAVADGPVFSVPDKWSWAQIARALGAFRSANQAKKNGWDGFPEDGFNSRLIKINRIRGEILVVVAKEESSWNK